MAATGMKITVSKNGPYLVRGQVPLSRQAIGANSEGDSIDWVEIETIVPETPAYKLCRCGHSANKPFCDGTHVRIGFVGDETARRQPYAALAQEIDGPTLALTDAQSLCAFARFCDRDGQVWNTVSQATTAPERAAFVRQVGQCPSGRLVAWDYQTRAPVEPDLPPSIAIVEDPQQGVAGPIWVRGGIPIESADGTPYEVRNRVTLCRCGQSKNKPFCDGTHAAIGFQDR
ncbi:iron-binding protein [Kaistia sp. 32K]|uniref:CDGSH iron-sulfur domain-containing protein n=1 Tax=Kaistia sp. 32K TaxID=2795690 RepID=UPI001914F0A9|nr:CDGSH iron-sulfur domain-containing protein [Kaistia sp. 32K]BCP53541.1 iron-binding protein [Kaistia sp. 32K]